MNIKIDDIDHAEWRAHLDESTEKLEDLAAYEGTELGEFWAWLAEAPRYEAFLGDFFQCIGNLIISQARRAGEECEIVEVEKTQTFKDKELIWKTK